MLIQKYKAKPIGSDIELIGYISESKKHLGNGCYDQNNIDYLLCVTDKSMPINNHRGCFIVDKNTIKKIGDDMFLDMFELLTEFYNDFEMFSEIKLKGYGERLEKIIENKI